MPTDIRLEGIVPYMAFATGGLGLLIGLAFLADTVWFLAVAARVTGVVIGHEARVSRDSEGTTTFIHLVVEFRDAGGVTRTVTLEHGASGPPQFSQGQEVAILYRSSNPAGARIRCFTHLWLFPIAALVFGGSGVAFGLMWQVRAGSAP